MPIDKAAKIWMNGELVDWDDANVHVLTHTLHYGNGVFEGIRAYETDLGAAVFRLTPHIERLFRSAKILCIDIPYTVDDLVDAVKETVRVNGLPSCYVRPIAYLGYGEMGLNPLPCTVDVAIATWPWGAYLGDEGVRNGVRMMISSWQRHDPNAMPPAAKGCGHYINSQMAKVQVSGPATTRPSCCPHRAKSPNALGRICSWFATGPLPPLRLVLGRWRASPKTR